MAGNFLADTMTSQEALTWHDGVNEVVSVFSPGATISGSNTVDLMIIPPGAQITDCTVYHNEFDTAAALMDVYGTIGGNEVYNGIASATFATGVVRQNADTGVGTRFTGSGVLSMRFTGLAAAQGTAPVVSVVTRYLRTLRGD